MATKPQSKQPIGFALLILLALLTALDAMAIDMYLPGMPNIATDLGADPARIQLTLSVFLIGLAIGQGIYGPLLDRYGRRLPLLAGIIIFILGSILAALSTSLETLLVARFLQAIGAAAGLVAPRAIIDDLCDLKESAQKLSILMQVMMIAPVVAPILGGMLLIYGEWHDIFWIMAFLGFIGLVWGWRSLPDSLEVEKRIPLGLKNIVSGYFSLLSQKTYVLYTLSGGFIMGAFFLYLSSSSFIFIEHFKLTSTQYSLVFATNSIGLILGGFVSNLLLNRGVATEKIMLFGIILNILAGSVLFLIITLTTPTFLIYAAVLAIAIATLGLVFGNLIALTMNAAESPAGTASALMGMMHYLIAAVIGFIISQASISLGQLPLTIALSGILAASCCWLSMQLQKQHLDVTN